MSMEKFPLEGARGSQLPQAVTQEVFVTPLPCSLAALLWLLLGGDDPFLPTQHFPRG